MREIKKIALCLILMMVLILPGVVLATEVPDLDISTETAIVEVVGGKQYSSISEAIKNIDNSSTTTIKLLTDVTDGAGFVVPEGSNIIFDFNGKTYNVTEPLVGSKDTETNGCQLLRDSTIVFKNGTFKSSTAYILVQNYSNLTLQDMTLDATASEVNDYVMSNNNGAIAITGNTSIKGNKVAFDVCWGPNKGYPKGAQVTVDTYGIIKGDIEIGTWGTISESNQNNVKSTLTINNINHNGSINVLKDYLKGQITINGGVFSEDVSDYLAEGLFCPELVEGEFTVKSSAKHKITVIQAEGGTVEVDKKEAQYGETVKVTVTVKDGYKLVSLECGDEGMGGDILGQDSFIMVFDGDVTIKPAFVKFTQEAVVPENVANSEEVEEMLIETLKELAKENSDLADAIENNNVEIVVDMDDEIELSSDKKEKLEEAAKKEVADLKVAKYLDITISVVNKENKNHLTNLEKLEEEITFSVAIPEEILDDEIEEGHVRKYYIIRDHNGDIDVWEVEAKDSKLEFSSNLFSTYAIAYKDVEATGSLPGASEDDNKKGEDEKLEEDGKKDEDEKLDKDDKKDNEKPEDNGNNPTTGDNIILYVVTLVVAVVGIASVVIIKKRRSLKK